MKRIMMAMVLTALFLTMTAGCSLLFSVDDSISSAMEPEPSDKQTSASKTKPDAQTSSKSLELTNEPASGRTSEASSFAPSSEIPPDAGIITDSGRYVSLDDGVMEIQISGVPEAVGPRVFKLSDQLMEEYIYWDIAPGDNILFTYYTDQYGDDVIISVEKM